MENGPGPRPPGQELPSLSPGFPFCGKRVHSCPAPQLRWHGVMATRPRDPSRQGLVALTGFVQGANWKLPGSLASSPYFSNYLCINGIFPQHTPECSITIKKKKNPIPISPRMPCLGVSPARSAAAMETPEWGCSLLNLHCPKSTEGP